jgi:hypothetical protein
VITGVRAPVARALRLTGLDETLFVGGPRGDDDDLDATDLSDRPPASR